MTVYVIGEIYNDGCTYESLSFSDVLTEEGGFSSEKDAIDRAKRLAEDIFNEKKSEFDEREKRFAESKIHDHTPPKFEIDGDDFRVTDGDDEWEFYVIPIEVH